MGSWNKPSMLIVETDDYFKNRIKMTDALKNISRDPIFYSIDIIDISV